MARAQLTNNASTVLASGISNVATSLTVAAGKGALFPAPSGGNYFYATLTEGTLIEIVQCTARTTDTLTITRAQEGTSAQTFTSAAAVKLNLTAAVLAELASKTDTETLTNKTIALGSNTVSGTIAQFNTAVTDADLATLAGTETLTGKTVNLTSNTLSGTTAQFNTALSDGDFATLAGAEALTNKSYNGMTLTSTTGVLTLTAGKTLAATNTLTLSGTDGTVMTFPPATADVGYLNVPQNSQSAAYTLVLADAGKHILHPSADTTARTFTIPANSSVAYPVGTAITFVNQVTAGVLTITITTDTMRLAGAGTTGSRTLAANGVATALKITATEWLISGTGLT